MKLRTLAPILALAITACSSGDPTEAEMLLDVMEEISPGAQLGLANVCSADKQEIVNQRGVGYAYELQPIFQDTDARLTVDGTFVPAGIEQIGEIELFHYSDASFGFNGMGAECVMWQV